MQSDVQAITPHNIEIRQLTAIRRAAAYGTADGLHIGVLMTRAAIGIN